MARQSANNNAFIGILGKEAYVGVTPGLSEEEVKVLEWAGALTETDQARELGELSGVVQIEQAGSLDESVAEAIRKAGKIVQTVNALGLRDEIMILVGPPEDITEKANSMLVTDALVELGTTALTTQGHELNLRLGLEQ